MGRARHRRPRWQTLLVLAALATTTGQYQDERDDRNDDYPIVNEQDIDDNDQQDGFNGYIVSPSPPPYRSGTDGGDGPRGTEIAPVSGTPNPDQVRQSQRPEPDPARSTPNMGAPRRTTMNVAGKQLTTAGPGMCVKKPSNDCIFDTFDATTRCKQPQTGINYPATINGYAFDVQQSVGGVWSGITAGAWDFPQCGSCRQTDTGGIDMYCLVCGYETGGRRVDDDTISSPSWSSCTTYSTMTFDERVAEQEAAGGAPAEKVVNKVCPDKLGDGSPILIYDTDPPAHPGEMSKVCPAGPCHDEWGCAIYNGGVVKCPGARSFTRAEGKCLCGNGRQEVGAFVDIDTDPLVTKCETYQEAVQDGDTIDANGMVYPPAPPGVGVVDGPSEQVRQNEDMANYNPDPDGSLQDAGGNLQDDQENIDNAEKALEDFAKGIPVNGMYLSERYLEESVAAVCNDYDNPARCKITIDKIADLMNRAGMNGEMFRQRMYDLYNISTGVHWTPGLVVAIVIASLAVAGLLVAACLYASSNSAESELLVQDDAAAKADPFRSQGFSLPQTRSYTV